MERETSMMANAFRAKLPHRAASPRACGHEDGPAQAYTPMPIHSPPRPPKASAIRWTAWIPIRFLASPLNRAADPDPLSGGHRRYGPIFGALEGARRYGAAVDRLCDGISAGSRGQSQP